MKKLVSLWTILLLGSAAYGQIINGIILDAATRNPVPVAVVYVDGTSQATYTDEQGKFTLDVKSYPGMPLTISALGYYSAVFDKLSTSRDITICLEPKIFEFADVNIRARGNSNIRKQNMSIFRREFLGRTKNAKECEILNENDIRFIRSENKDTLKAYSLKPVFIVNRALGYRITCYINKFEYVESAYRNQLIGNSIFDEDTSLTDPETIRMRRDNAYYGSKMHFIRSLWDADLKPTGYSIKKEKKQVNPGDIVRKQLSTTPGQYKKLIYYPEGAPVILNLKWGPGKTESGMELLRNNIGIEENGFYKGPGIIWHGEMAKQGIADLLPYDYKPYGEFDEKYYTNFLVENTVYSMTNVTELTEKVYLHTDRDIYSPGDDIWLKAYLIDGLSHELSDSSGNLYVELISPESKIITKKIIKLQKGLGNGDFILPENLPSGNYALRAYTSYLRNFGDQAFYYKNIIITTGSELHLLTNGSDSLKNENEQTEFQFFPEGGSLIENVLSVVAFKAVDIGGLGCEVTGQVHSSSGEPVTSFRSTPAGMGKFTFRPEEGAKYSAVITTPDGSTIRTNVPAIFPTGFVLNAQKNNLNETLITLRTNSKTFSGYKDRDVAVTLSSHGKILKVLSVRINSLNTSFVLPEEELPNGIIMITVYSHDNKPLCERLLYIDNKPVITVEIEPDNQRYQKRDSVTIKFSVNCEQGTENNAFLSLSVSNEIYSYSHGTTISSWFLMESDVRGPVVNPSQYFDHTNSSRLMNLDLLLLTQGWRDFEWKYGNEKFLPEKGFIISGRMRKSLFDIPYINKDITLAILQNENNFITTSRTDSSGRFRFELENLMGNAKILLSAADKRGNFTGKILLDTIYDDPPPVYENLPRQIFIKEPDEENNLSRIKETDNLKLAYKKHYTLSDTILIGEVQITGKKKESAQEMLVARSRDKYGTPDKEIVVTPILRNAGSIRELLTGKVGGMMFVKPQSPFDSGIRIRGISSMTLSQEPLFMLDGMTVSYGTLSAIPVSFIDRIDVIKSERAAAFGMQGANGIISVITKNSPEGTNGSVMHTVSRTVEGFSATRIFYSPKHKSSRSPDYSPDLRSTLLWLPNLEITTNKEYRVKLFNGDIPSTYRIEVEGITSDGIPFTGHAGYNLLN